MLNNNEIYQLEQINHYWFNILKPEQWFLQSDQVDQEIRSRFKETLAHFRTRDLPNHNLNGSHILAAIILFDQMPRNIYRNDAKAFETDDLALSLSYLALANRHDLEMTDIEKSFIYLPLEHSENIKDQELCLSLFQQRTSLSTQIDYAQRHYNIIKKFGRFPHRNELLGRISTPEEEDYLKSGGETFGTKDK